MRKEKRKEEVEFNLSDYDYLNNEMRPLGWVWEFERRSDAYKEAYLFEKKADKKQWEDYLKNPLVSDLVFLNDTFNPSKKWIELPQNFESVFSKANPLNVINLKWGGYTPSLKTHHEYKGMRFEIDPPPYRRKPNNLLKHQIDNQNVVMALIDISCPDSVDNILEKLKKELIKWRKLLKLPETRQPKMSKKNENLLIKNSKIWKSYLIVYDLVQSGASYGDVSDVLSQYDELYISEKVVENHYKSAVKMIDGGYKKFI